MHRQNLALENTTYSNNIAISVYFKLCKKHSDSILKIRANTIFTTVYILRRYITRKINLLFNFDLKTFGYSVFCSKQRSKKLDRKGKVG